MSPNSGGASGDCPSATPKALLDFIQAHDPNITALVDKCPKACTALYGSPNPDISGIGVTISFLIQLWSWGFLAITLPLLISILRRSLGSRFPTTFRQLNMSLYRVALVSLLTNVTFGFSSIVASKVEQNKGPIALEEPFLDVVVVCEYALCLLNLFTVSCLSNPSGRTKIVGNVAIYVLPIGATMLAVVFSYATSVGQVPQPTDTYQSVIDECVERYGLPNFQMTPNDELWPYFSVLPFSLVAGIAGGYSLMLQLFLAFDKIGKRWISDDARGFRPSSGQPIKARFLRTLVSIGRNIFEFLCARSTYFIETFHNKGRSVAKMFSDKVSWHDENGRVQHPLQQWIVFVLLNALLHWSWAIGFTNALLKRRKDMRALSWEDYEDNEWGFGQVVAVGSWLALAITFTHEARDCISEAIKERKQRKNGSGVADIETGQESADRSLPTLLEGSPMRRRSV